MMELYRDLIYEWGMGMPALENHPLNGDNEVQNALGERAGKLLIVNMDDARKKRIWIAILLGFFLLTLILPHLNPIPQVQIITINQQNKVIITNELKQSAFAAALSKNNSVYRAAFELMMNPGSITTKLVKETGGMGHVTWLLYIALYAVPVMLGLGVAGVVFSLREERRKRGIFWMRIGAWGLVAAYATIIVSCMVYNIGVNYVKIMGLPLIALLELVIALFLTRQVFYFTWFACPEMVMRKEIERASIYRDMGTKRCDYCHEMIAETLESCPQCGHSLVERWKCKYCKQLNTPSRTHCYSCGHAPNKR